MNLIGNNQSIKITYASKIVTSKGDNSSNSEAKMSAFNHLISGSLKN